MTLEQATLDDYLRTVNSMADCPRELQSGQFVNLYVRVCLSLSNALADYLGNGTPDERVVALANRHGANTAAAQVLCCALAKARAIKHAAVDFETATVAGGSVGELIRYRKRKSAWGNLKTVREMTAEEIADAEGSPFIVAYIFPENPIRIKQATRNELKWALGKRGPRLVASVTTGYTYKDKPTDKHGKTTNSKRAFLADLSREDAALIRGKTGLEPDDFWRACKHGNRELAGRLSEVPNKARGRAGGRGRMTGEPYGKGPREVQTVMLK